ncbi:TPA: hypothetical protein ACSTJZ_001331 [Serratia fonticola]|uniref:hypothetical protein n=1 Tax=Serratia fonticola TaxID=47917 RepID=UPI002183CA32|nr:hypothetical protein [Serratia fonticola]CAI2146225.1 Uncharacterised protein [Serratia fonticola]HBE9179261.1 hypothetical protein [Serratia fonticola]
MTLGDEDKIASVAALLELLSHCDEDTKIETIQTTALLGWMLLREVKLKPALNME